MILSLASLLLLPLFSLAEEEISLLGDWQRAPRSVRCRPGVNKEQNSCRRRTIGGATVANFRAALGAEISITIPVPELETEVYFDVPFALTIDVSIYLLDWSLKVVFRKW